jgi:hypothetical protein
MCGEQLFCCAVHCRNHKVSEFVDYWESTAWTMEWYCVICLFASLHVTVNISLCRYALALLQLSCGFAETIHDFSSTWPSFFLFVGQKPNSPFSCWLEKIFRDPGCLLSIEGNLPRILFLKSSLVRHNCLAGNLFYLKGTSALLFLPGWNTGFQSKLLLSY